MARQSCLYLASVQSSLWDRDLGCRRAGGAILIGGLSALGAGLFSLGIPKDSVLKYETSIKAGKFLLIAHGTADEVEGARAILHTSGAEEINFHTAPGETQAATA